MIGIRPCPNCGGEVEVIRLQNDKEGNKQYRIQCYKCGYTVAKGTKFPEETEAQGAERIKQYNDCMRKLFSKPGD